MQKENINNSTKKIRINMIEFECQCLVSGQLFINLSIIHCTIGRSLEITFFAD